MNPSDSNDRIERLKQVLADSYPQRAEGRAKEPLPESVLAALEGREARTPSPTVAKASFFEKVAAMFRTPQLAAVGMAAVVVIAAVWIFNPFGSTTTDPGPGPGPQDFRSPGGDSKASIVIVTGLSDEQVSELQDSGYFREDQLVVVPSDSDLQSALEANRRPNLVLVDGGIGEISTPFAGDDGPDALAFSSDDDDLAELILETLAELPEPADEDSE
ncbi:hypothetical protein HAHE_21470 [Haloferula helveola]|uniref:DUF4350 domain-containing protein n=1 Tax=Haloferula helveola TaxID=490095 RepID=A0ABN6H6K8_9BACT|nr:hypothetical protein HAHE_21470 [Haloferula helveola]